MKVFDTFVIWGLKKSLDLRKNKEATLLTERIRSQLTSMVNNPNIYHEC